MARQKEENGFLFYVMVALLVAAFILSFVLPASAQQMRRFQGVVCDTVEQIENWATLFKGGMDGDEALSAINTAEQNPIACAAVDIIVATVEVEKELTLSGEDAVILKLLVIGAMTPIGPQPIQPAIQYGAGPAKGYVASKTSI